MGEFIKVEVDSDKCTGLEACGACIRICPVNIFREAGRRPTVIRENEDECILCDLCLEECSPGAIVIRRLYAE